jgi:hypothetical protein
MAIFHFSMRNINVGRGQSSAARVRYILRQGVYHGVTEDSDLHSHGASLPAWAGGDAELFFSVADAGEKRGQVAKSIDLALQAEFSLEENEQLLRNFIAKNLVNSAGQRLPCVWAIHALPDNPHAHIIYSLRADDGLNRDAPETYFKRALKHAPERGGAAKDATLKQRDWLITIRKNWANQCNAAFAAADLPDRISSLSLRAQGLDRQPGTHLGPMLSRQEKLLKEITELNAILATLEGPAPNRPMEDEVSSPSPSPVPSISMEGEDEDEDDGYDSPSARRRRAEEEEEAKRRRAEIAALEAAMSEAPRDDPDDDDYPSSSPTPY